MMVNDATRWKLTDPHKSAHGYALIAVDGVFRVTLQII